MHAGRTPASRPRSRSQWDEYYRNLHKELKGNNNQESGDRKNVVDSESINGDGDDILIYGEKRKCQGNIERSVKRTKNGVGRIVEEEQGNNVIFESRVFSGKEKVDLTAQNDADEEVVSSGSSLKSKPESRSGSELKTGNLDEVVSDEGGNSVHHISDSDDVSDEGGNSVHHISDSDDVSDEGGNSVHHISDSDDVSDDSKNSKDSRSSSESSDGEEMSEDESTSEEDNELSDDEDYMGDEPASASDDDDSDVLYEVERRNDENDGLMEGEEKSSNTMEDEKTLCRKNKKECDLEETDCERDEGYNGGNDDGVTSCKRSSNQEKQEEDVTIVIDDTKSTRISRKNEIDNDSDEGYNGDNDDGITLCKRSSNQEKLEEDVIILINEKDKFPAIRKSTRVCGKIKNDIHDDEDKIPNLIKKVNDNTNESIVKKRKDLGLDNSVGSEKKSNDKEGSSVAKRLRSCTVSKKGPQFGQYTDPVPILESDESDSCRDDDENRCDVKHVGEKGSENVRIKKKNNRAATDVDMIKRLLESINSEKSTTIEENDDDALPLRFRFEDEVEPVPEKSEWEKQMDLLFGDLELGLRESEIECDNSSVTENDEPVSVPIDNSPAACCRRGEHHSILDEQIGIVCKYCTAVIMDIKYILPPFYKPPPRRRDRKDFYELPTSIADQIHFQDSISGNQFSTTHARGTVWDLIPGIGKMYPHQIEGFEFMWRKIAGDIIIQNLERPLPEGGSGCIISHAPGTGKTRLAIVFLQSFLKMYPACYPVIVAPRGMLLTWQSELKKWKADIPFHNLNMNDLSGGENKVAASIFGPFFCVGGTSKELIRVLKLYSWRQGRSILGVSYNLFDKLAGAKVKQGLAQQIKKLLLESPGLLVLDEGHTPRNEESLIFKTLAKVTTKRRIILSGTPFQNNLKELYNTLCLVNPKFANQMKEKCSTSRKKWRNLASSIGTNLNDSLKTLKTMLNPFVHVHKGTILEESLPGLRETLVFLHPTELQKTLFEIVTREDKIFYRIFLVSLVSIHPSLLASHADACKRFLSPCQKSQLKEIESDVDAGVKTRFVMKLICLASALGERVLVFSQYIDPLNFMKEKIKSHFSWNEGKEVLYMDGKLDEKQRQESIASFNDEKSDAKVLLASKKACSEGINLIGASRVVLLDTLWNPSVEKQAICRAYRIGQKRVVYVYHLCTSGTEVALYAQQIKKERISELIFSPVDGRNCPSSPVEWEDKVLESMLGVQGFSHIFEKIIRQPKESDLVETFGIGA